MPGLVPQEGITSFKICNMRSIQSEVDHRKLLFFAMLTLKEHGNLVSELFKCRIKSYFVDTSCSVGFIKC